MNNDPAPGHWLYKAALETTITLMLWSLVLVAWPLKGLDWLWPVASADSDSVPKGGGR